MSGRGRKRDLTEDTLSSPEEGTTPTEIVEKARKQAKALNPVEQSVSSF